MRATNRCCCVVKICPRMSPNATRQRYLLQYIGTTKRLENINELLLAHITGHQLRTALQIFRPKKLGFRPIHNLPNRTASMHGYRPIFSWTISVFNPVLNHSFLRIKIENHLVQNQKKIRSINLIHLIGEDYSSMFSCAWHKHFWVYCPVFFSYRGGADNFM